MEIQCEASRIPLILGNHSLGHGRRAEQVLGGRFFVGRDLVGEAFIVGKISNERKDQRYVPRFRWTDDKVVVVGALHGDLITPSQTALVSSRRGNAYFYYRMALKFKDTEAAARYRAELRRLKVKPDMMRAMLKRAHPLGMLNSRERRKFLRTLTPTEERSLRRAIEWWRETYVGGAAGARRD